MTRERLPRRLSRERAVVTVVSAAALAAFLFPVYWLVNASFQDDVTSANIDWVPLRFSWEGYRLAIAEQLPNVGTSLIIAFGTAIITLVIAVPAAYGLSRMRSRIVDAVLIATFIAQIVPGIVLATAMYTMFSAAGILNTHLAIILADTTLAVPFAILVVRSFMRVIPDETLEAATIDGAGPLRAFRSIVIPLSKNAIVTAGLFAFLFAWGDLIFAITMSTDPAIRPITIGIYRYMGSEVDAWNAVMASGVLAALPVLLITLFAQRSLVDGLTMGAGR